MFPKNIKSPGFGAGRVLDAERANASFEIEELSRVLYGGAQQLEERRKLHALLHQDPVFSKRDKFFLSRDELYVRGLKATAKFCELANELNFTEEQFNTAYIELGMLTPIHLHRNVFVHALKQQLSDEQQKKWIPLVKDLTVIGTYAQTELGHGSFIRGLETTATFDEKTDEFVLNSPTLTSIKWWPGNLAKTSNHCVVMAQLLVRGQNYGLQGFIVPVRDIQSHKLLPGIEMGDIGPKFGFDMIDNGYLKMTNVRIPRDYMLMRYVSLSRNGEFKASKHSKILYATMVSTRVGIVFACARSLARAAVIATRYSAVRRQFPVAGDAGEELQVIDYQTQQQKLTPNLATAYTLHFAFKWLKGLFDRNTVAIHQGDFSLMAELHAVAACLKSLSSELCVEGMEICRKSCGGHGYMKFSGIIDAYQDALPAQTYEGENTVMYLQTARFLMKSGRQALTGKKPDQVSSISYLFEPNLVKSKCPVETASDFANINVLLQALRVRSAFVIFSTLKSMGLKVKFGMSQNQAWDVSLIDLTRAAQAHAHCLLAQSFADGLKQLTTTSGVKNVLEKLLCVYAGGVIERASGDLQEAGYFSGKQSQIVREFNQSMLGKLRPDMVALADAWDFSDYILNSALGRYDGNVYEDLFNWAQGSRLNVIPVDEEVRKYLKPLTKAANL